GFATRRLSGAVGFATRRLSSAVGFATRRLSGAMGFATRLRRSGASPIWGFAAKRGFADLGLRDEASPI
ncbi:hypothetical protein FCV25MIE_05045, partial [Fagus crenata]